MTQHDLARAVEMPQSSIARIEAGKVTPMTATLMALLRATGHQLAVERIGPAVPREEIRRHLRMRVPARTRAALGRKAKDRRTSPMRIIVQLRRFGVPFVVVGDLAEAAHGSSVRVGRAIEICVATTDVARERLARARDDLGKMASAGRLRVKNETAAGDDYDVLRRNALTMFVDAGINARVAAIEDLIRVRRARGHPKDLAVAAELSAIAEETD